MPEKPSLESPSATAARAAAALARSLADGLDSLAAALVNDPRPLVQPWGSPEAGPLAAASESLWTVDEVAEYLKASKSWAYDAAAAGRLPCVRIGGRLLRFVPEAVMAYARGEPVAKAVPTASRRTPVGRVPPMFQRATPLPTTPSVVPGSPTAQPSSQAPTTAPIRPMSGALPWEMQDGMLSPRQAAQRLGISRATVYALCERGELPSRRSGVNWLMIDPAELEAYLAKKAGK
jgi:excisionase family DNA binding protein